MKLQHLRFLTAVVDHGGVIRAAERLHLSQPTLTSGLKALEQSLGKPIFDRTEKTSRPLRLTPAGRRFYSDAIEILRQCDSARASFIDSTSEKSRICIGVIDTLPQLSVIKVMQGIRQRLPNIQIELREGTPDRIASLLAQGRIDLAWTNISDLSPDAVQLWREPVVAVVSRDHPLANGSPASIALRDIENVPFIFRLSCELDAVGRAQLKVARASLKVMFRAERDDFAFQLVRAGEGFTFSPRSLVPEDLATLNVSDFIVHRVIGLQWQEGLDVMHRAVVTEAAQNVTQMM
ncbi:LysR family transcriptional regulator [Ferriphaselus sp. R-1]|uniref:LysR family transcriptional regulator n=1 Tax=Ferriphaselus sp. R-1 TaxID=1485544 RepID=UPI0009E0235C|nr:LysR family transcriptional regulator [Ferriphaselus sp. R-1]